jgi:hypothetical protein
MAGLVLAVGLIQLPMWVLSSFPIIRNVAVPPLEAVNNPQTAATETTQGFFTLAIAIGVVGLVLVLILALIERRIISTHPNSVGRIVRKYPASAALPTTSRRDCVGWVCLQSAAGHAISME